MLKFVRALFLGKARHTVNVTELNVRGVSVANNLAQLTSLQQPLPLLGLTTQGVWVKGTYASLEGMSALVSELVPSKSAALVRFGIQGDNFEMDFVVSGELKTGELK